jgi:copper oxidase (laccase) domain-containing protein
VGTEFKAHFPDDVASRNGRLYLDMIAANRRQVLGAGVKPEHIFDAQICTACDKNYFSFRRDKEKAGRMISLMML